MATEDIRELIGALSEGIVLADESELELLASLHDKFGRVAALLADSSHAPLSQMAAEAVMHLESVMLRESEDAKKTLEVITQTVTNLQAVIVDERPIEEIEPSGTQIGQAGADEPAEEEPQVDVDESVSDVSAGSESPADLLTTDVADDADQPPNSDQACKDPSKQELAPQPLGGDPDLIIDFVQESQEHLDATDVHLLTIESDATDQETLNAVFRAFHTIKGVAGFLELTQIQELAHESETLLDKCRKHQLTLAGPVLDVVFDATDLLKKLVLAVESALSGAGILHPVPGLPQVITRIQDAADGKTPAPKAEAAPPAVDPDPSVESKADSSSTPRAAAGGSSVKETVRVDAERLDKLVDTIGEMVIAEAMVSQAVELDSSDASGVGRLLNHLDKITRELQELAMSLRMVPVRATFQRMARLARDVSKKLSKPIDWVTNGEDTELDKNVVDAIGDPLVHMVRNAVDHGLETPDERRAAGKPEVGRVELRAYHQGGSIYIEIEDDGGGLDRDIILAKAREREVVTDGENLSDSEVFSLIFEPGFSTAKQITDVSGRGVGLDVVKRNIQALRGKVDIQSEKGKGTTFSIRLPLTLAIIEGMIVRLGTQRLVIPTLSIVRMIRPGEQDLSSVFDRGELLKLGDQLLPLFRLDRTFEIAGAVQDPTNAAVVVVEHENRQIAFLVDELLGQQQIVIKPLGQLLQKYPGFSGGAIMPDGRVGLILDVASICGMSANSPELRRAA